MVFDKTESLCPVCLRRIDAELLSDETGVYLTKTCRDHGRFKTLVWRGTTDSFSAWGRSSQCGGGPEKILTDANRGCPYDCGPCAVHNEGVCLALIEVTSRCNIRCPVCFASSRETKNGEPDLAAIERRYKTILDCCGPAPVQLSGGEPTVREDLPEIVALGKRLGFDMIQINTNGVRLAEDRGYLARLRDSGTKVIYLQYDGVSDDVYAAIRGTPLVTIKTKVLENCAEAGLGVVLVPTIVPGVNDNQIGSIIHVAKEWMPVVRGVHFQPVSYFGRYPRSPRDEDRITIPEILAAVESQTAGEVRQADFKPRISKDGHCAFSGFFVLGDDNLLTTGFGSSGRITAIRPAPAVRGFLSKCWSPIPHDISKEIPKDVSDSCSCHPCSCTGAPQESLSIDSLLNWVQSRSLTISGMPFQDVWNIDLRRLAGCCIYVATESHLVPFCAYYVTSIGGTRLYGQ